MTQFRFRAFTIAGFGLALLVGLAVAPPSAMAKQPKDEVIAIIQGKPVYRKDLNSPELAKAREDAYRLESRMLMEEAIKRLRAKKPKEFPRPDLKISEAEIKAVYARANLKERGPLEAFEDRIRDYIINERTMRHDTVLFQMAVSKGYVKSNLTQPPAFRYRLPAVQRKASKGSFKAPIHIVEFSDFQ